MASSPALAPSRKASDRPPLVVRLRRWRGWWATLVVAAAIVPVAGVFSLHRVFHVRDLSLFFWGRHVWTRRSLLAGEWPLWDPFMGAGQSAVADALNQMFLLPVLALRLIGSEIVGFNLWVALPFPCAALGTYYFLRGRFSAPASALGAIAFAASGPVVSTGNFPNLSWSVAAMPWVFWAADRLLARGGTRRLAVLAGAFAFQALAGEPVTMTATGGAVAAYSLWAGSAESDQALRGRLRGFGSVSVALALGLMGAAVQLLPLSAAVRDSWRVYGAGKDFWSLHPLALAETVSPHLFGDYFSTSYFAVLPWMPPVNSGRDPFFFSIYFGTALTALALFGAIAGWRRTWSGFWVALCTVALFAAFGPHTPFYPFLRDHVPVVASFRFPVKYLLLVALALAALAASGWDALSSDERRATAPGRYRWARMTAVAMAVSVAVAAYVLSGACVYVPDLAERAFLRLARYVGVSDPVDGAAYLLKTLPTAASRVMLLSLGGALFLAVASSRRREARLARITLYSLIGVELLVAAWGINPTFDAVHYRQPDWITATRRDQQSRFYFGGKIDGTVDMRDLDAPQSFVRPFHLSPLDGRGALSVQTVFLPAAWRAREMLSYDLAVLWPRPFELAVSHFRRSDRAARDRFLWRTGVRYRIVPARIGGDRPSVPIEYFNDLRLFDWGPVFPRVSIVPTAITVPDVREQVAQLFSESFDPAQTIALTTQAPDLWGRPGPPVRPSARVVRESANTVTVETGVPAAGGYLLLLDSFSPGWRATVDGEAATMYRANALFRAVRLAPGRHTVHFRYLPDSFVIGAILSVLAVLICGVFALNGNRPVRLPDVRLSRRTAGLVVILLCLLGLVGLLFWAPGYLTERGFPLDDAWIHAVYGRSLAATGTMSYNPGEPATGETSPLWAAVIALPHLVTSQPQVVVTAIKLIGFSLHVVTAVLFFLVLDSSLGRRPLSLLGASLIALSPDLVAASVSGMEVPLATAIVATAVWAVHRNDLCVLAVCAVLAPLARPELSAVVLALPLIAVRGVPSRALRGTVVAAFGVASAFGGMAVRNLWVSGRPLPSTFYAKVGHVPVLLSERLGFVGLFSKFPLVDSPWLVGALAAIALWQIVRLWRRDDTLAAAGFLSGLAFCSASFAVIVPVDPTAFYHQRYVLPAMPLLLAFLPVLVTVLTDRLPERLRGPALFALAMALVGALLVHAPNRFWHLSNDAHNIDDVQVAVGMSLASASPADVVWAVDAGAIRYFGKAFVVDTMALNCRQLLQAPAGTSRYLATRQPRYLEVVPGWSWLRATGVVHVREFRPSTPYTVTGMSAMQAHTLVACPDEVIGEFGTRRAAVYSFKCQGNGAAR